MTIEIANVYCKLNVKWIKNIKDYIEWIKKQRNVPLKHWLKN